MADQASLDRLIGLNLTATPGHLAHEVEESLPRT